MIALSSMDNTFPNLLEQSSSQDEKMQIKSKPKSCLVQFKATVRVRQVQSCDCYSPAEREMMWYSQEETDEMRYNAATTLRRMTLGVDVDMSDDDCSRGLECRMPKKNQERIQRRAIVKKAVLQEQIWNLSRGHELDDRKLATICASHTFVSSIEAAARGSNDALEAQRSF